MIRRVLAAFAALGLWGCSAGAGTRSAAPAVASAVPRSAPAAGSGSLTFSVTVPADSRTPAARRLRTVHARTRSFAYNVDGSTVATQNVGIGKTGCTTDYTAPSVYEFATSAGGEPRGMALDANGNVWFVEDSGAKTDRINADDSITVFPNGGRTVNTLTLATDGTFFLSYLYGAADIGHFDPTSLMYLPTVQSGGLQSASMVRASDGTLFYTAFNNGTPLQNVYRMDGTGATVSGSPYSLTSTANAVGSGPDAVYITESASLIAKITTAGVVSEFSVPSPGRITTGGTDGNVYFPDVAGYVNQMTTAGSVTNRWYVASANGMVAPAFMLGIVQGPDGAFWMPVYQDANSNGFVVRMTTSGAETVIPMPTANSQPWSLVFDPRGAIYVSERNAAQIAQITFPQRCTTQVASVAAGTRTISAVAYDGINGTGNALSAALVGTTVIADQANVVSLTLSPVVASAAVQAASGFSSCSAGSIPVTITAKDALGATIVGPYVAANGTSLTFVLADVTSVGSSLSSTTISSSTASVNFNYLGSSGGGTDTIYASGGGITATPRSINYSCS